MFLIQSLFPQVRDYFRNLQIPQFLDNQIARIKVPKTGIGRFFFCYASELISFFIIATNFRALAKGFILWTVCTDGLIVLQNTIIGKLFNEDQKMRDGLSIAAFTLGGMAGSALSIVLTKYIWGS
jgi:predicted MFS family arabinose efflux permease